MKATLFLLPFAAVLLASCAKAIDNEPGTVIKDPAASALPATVNKAMLLKLVNDVRKKGCRCGDTYYNPVPAVTWNNQLELAAYNHSRDMYQNNYFSHTAPDGSNVSDRIQQAGYKWTAYGENIGAGYKTEKEVVEGWISSPGHCKNLMNSKYKEMGVARVGDYWTQDLAAK